MILASRFPRGAGIALAAAALAGVTLIALDRLFPLDLTRYMSRSPELRDESGALVHVALTLDGMWRLPARPEDVSARYLSLLVAKEDHRFWYHLGVDPLALTRAAWQLAARGHIVSGGSTLTMQVARLLVPHRHDFVGKLIEIAHALQLEAHYSKRDILAMYLTLAPFGGNIEGVRAASLSYFGHEPAALSDGEAALLVALPRSPTRLQPGRHRERAIAAARHVLRRAGVDPAEIGSLAVAPHPLMALAPHLAVRLAGLAGPVQTTLDLPLQSSVEALAQREKPWLGADANMAALVVRNADRAVIAYLGGADYFGPRGMVDMVRARRSPGSTLKPFIYGIAFDDALLVPDTLVDDVPIRIGDYAPHDFDGEFHGTVTAREALQQSYNLPAVEILNRIGPVRFVAALTQSGVHIALPRGDAAPGLPIALGGLAISLEDVVTLYTALADGGEVGPLRLLRSDPEGPTTALMTAASAREIDDILRGTPRPDGFAPSNDRAIAYKTGTSYGLRDAWAVGYSDRYTVGVWVGRTEGTPRPGAFGLNTAAPALFKIFGLLPEEPPHLSLAAPRPEKQVELAPGLRYFGTSDAAFAPTTDRPRIVYPPSGATLDISDSDGSAVPIGLEASGGKPPYRWIVNGIPLPMPPIGSVMSWVPDGPGFVRLSVIDADNHAVSEGVRLE
jgi:penicillin-binding protein 1C